MTPASNVSILPLTDSGDALRRANDRPEVASELFKLLCGTLEEAATRIAEAAQANDRRRLRDAVHSLRGASLYCGVPRLRAAASEVETLCSIPDDHDGAARLAGSVEQLLHTIEATRTTADPVARHLQDC